MSILHVVIFHDLLNPDFALAWAYAACKMTSDMSPCAVQRIALVFRLFRFRNSRTWYDEGGSQVSKQFCVSLLTDRYGTQKGVRIDNSSNGCGMSCWKNEIESRSMSY